MGSKRIFGTSLACLALAPAVAVAAPPSAVMPDTDLQWCRKGTGESCTLSELADPVVYRQILVYSTGYTGQERAKFRADYDAFVIAMRSARGEAVYSRRYQDRLLYIARFTAGGELGEGDAAFGGRIALHPVRGDALSLDQSAVVALTDELAAAEGLSPLGVAVVFDSDSNPTANAAPPTFLGRSYGIARFTRGQIDEYVPMHEIAHGALNFLDEYIEAGFEKVSIRLLDVLSPFAVNDGSWKGIRRGISDFFGVFDYRISEILAANGSGNLDTSPEPSRVSTEGYTPNGYEFEGGMFFGKGTFHDFGENVMGDWFVGVDGDGFGWNHSGSQAEVIEQVFEHPEVAPRPNDRLRNAGPLSGRWLASGKVTSVFLFDADKHHRFHPTLAWDVQVGWYEKGRGGAKCRPDEDGAECGEKVWRTIQKRVLPEPNRIVLPGSLLETTANFLQGWICMLHFSTRPESVIHRICSDSAMGLAGTFLPTLEFPAPYQSVEIPLEKGFTKYYWRFRSDNGTWKSGWTGWSAVSRGI